MKFSEYDADRLLSLGYPQEVVDTLDFACWAAYKQGGRIDSGKKRKALIAGPSAGSASFAEKGGTGIPCGNSHISSSKTCHVGGSGGYKNVVEAIEADMGSSLDAAHEKILEDRYAKAKDVRDLGRIHKKAIKDIDNDELDAKEGVLNAIKKAMTDHLEANMVSGVGAKREAELAAMSPEERRRARTADAIAVGIKNKVVSGRR